MDQNNNFKKLLCCNIVNGTPCVYNNKCIFAHTLEEQIKEPNRQYVHNMIHVWENISHINVVSDKILFDELVVMSKECKHCINKQCSGGHNCKFGACLKSYRVCYDDLMCGNCPNYVMKTKTNGENSEGGGENVVRVDVGCASFCTNGVHLTEKKLIPYVMRNNIDTGLINGQVNVEKYNYLKNNSFVTPKNSICSIVLTKNTLGVAHDLIDNYVVKTHSYNNCNNRVFVSNNNNKVVIDRKNPWNRLGIVNSNKKIVLVGDEMS